MNSYGGKTTLSSCDRTYQFESSVNSYGGKTGTVGQSLIDTFESSVNSYGGKTVSGVNKSKASLRVV